MVIFMSILSILCGIISLLLDTFQLIGAYTASVVGDFTDYVGLESTAASIQNTSETSGITALFAILAAILAITGAIAILARAKWGWKILLSTPVILLIAIVANKRLIGQMPWDYIIYGMIHSGTAFLGCRRAYATAQGNAASPEANPTQEGVKSPNRMQHIIAGIFFSFIAVSFLSFVIPSNSSKTLTNDIVDDLASYVAEEMQKEFETPAPQAPPKRAESQPIQQTQSAGAPDSSIDGLCTGIVTVNTKGIPLNVRNGPSMSYEVVGQLEDGDSCTASEWSWDVDDRTSDSRWFLIHKTDNDVSGWVNGDFCIVEVEYLEDDETDYD